MTELHIEVDLTYDIAEATSMVFALHAAETPDQRLLHESLEVTGAEDERVDESPHPSECRVRTRSAPGTVLSIAYRATVEVRPRPRPGPDDADLSVHDLDLTAIWATAPSRCCPSQRFDHVAQRVAGDAGSNLARVEAICDWTRDQLDYVPGSTTNDTTAADALVAGVGVCRDFAHLAISACRALDVPARYVAGYGLGVEPADFHGFVEAHVGGAWHLFDPTGMTTPSGLVEVCRGRDADDAPFATIFGTAELTNKRVDVSEA